MNKEIVRANKKEDKKHMKGFIAFLICCYILGVAVGSGIAFGEDILVQIAFTASHGLKAMSIYANTILTVISIVIVTILYRQIKNLYSKWDGEEEEVANSIDKKCNYVLTIAFVNQIILYVFMEIGILRLEEIEAVRTGWDIRTFIFAFGIIFSEVFILVSQQRIVNFAKEMNPEKQGSVFDVKFQKKWLESCDEAEKMFTYEAAFASYNAVQKTCIILWVFCFVGMLIWDFGVVPVCMIGIVWMVSTLSYCLKSIELGNK